MERDAILASQKFLNNYALELPDEIQAHLLIEVNGNDQKILMREIEGIVSVLEQFKTDEILFADTEKTKEDLWRLRRVTGEAAKGTSIYKEEDTVVPRAKLPQLLAKVKELGKQYGTDSICYGHAGEANVKVNITKIKMSDEGKKNQIPEVIRGLIVYAKESRGTISGEHGIGYVQKKYIDIAFSESELDLMRKIKTICD